MGGFTLFDYLQRVNYLRRVGGLLAVRGGGGASVRSEGGRGSKKTIYIHIYSYISVQIILTFKGAAH